MAGHTVAVSLNLDLYSVAGAVVDTYFEAA